jgi:hypothetical protein
VSVNRDRKIKARIVALEMQKRFALLATATTQEEITDAATELGKLFNENIEILIWSLRKAGGLDTPAVDVPPMPKLLERLNEGTAYL